jgi:hypothetical protein
MYYATGHIHALQFHTYNGVNYIISGAGSKTLKVEQKPGNVNYCNAQNCERWNEKGFFELDLFRDGTSGVTIYHNSGEEAEIIKSPVPVNSK